MPVWGVATRGAYRNESDSEESPEPAAQDARHCRFADTRAATVSTTEAFNRTGGPVEPPEIGGRLHAVRRRDPDTPSPNVRTAVADGVLITRTVVGKLRAVSVRSS
jgi:hypothetical protein